MKSRDLGILLFGLAGLYSLLLALSGLAELLLQLSRSSVVVAGQLRIQASLVSGAVDVLARLAFGAALLAGRRALADALLGAGEMPAGVEAGRAAQPREKAPARAGRSGGAGAAAAAAGALGVAAAGVCALAILLIARVVTALSYGASLLLVRGNTGDLAGWTFGGILVDLLLAAAGVLLLAERHRVAARLVEVPADLAGETPWQLPAMRFLGLVLVVWHLPALASAGGVFVKWWLRPVGFDLRAQAIDHIPPAATGVVAGLYFLLLFPAGLSSIWRRLRPLHE
jgi:hypothetical protein